jgi:hypothetical protein
VCLELTAREVSRTHHLPPLDGTWKLAPPPTTNLEAVRAVVRHAPPPIWPRLVPDLWRLVNLDSLRVLSLPATVVIWQEIVGQMLRRTFAEARPTDLGDAAPGFFRWLEELPRAGLPEEELEPLLHPRAEWIVPPVVRFLEALVSWGDHSSWPSAAFQRRATRAAAEARAELDALGTEMTPATTREGSGHEVAPVAVPDGDGAEWLTKTPEARE